MIRSQSTIIKPSGKKLRSWLKTVTGPLGLNIGSLNSLKSIEKYYWFIATTLSDSCEYGDIISYDEFDSSHPFAEKIRVIGIPVGFFGHSNSIHSNKIQQFALDSTAHTFDPQPTQSDSRPKQVVLPQKQRRYSDNSLVVQSEDVRSEEEIDPSETKYRFFSSGSSPVEEAVAAFAQLSH